MSGPPSQAELKFVEKTSEIRRRDDAVTMIIISESTLSGLRVRPQAGPGLAPAGRRLSGSGCYAQPQGLPRPGPGRQCRLLRH